MDLSNYSGLVFWAKTESSPHPWQIDSGQSDHTIESRIRVLIEDRFSAPAGKICIESNCIRDTAHKCWNAFSTTLRLTESFSRYEVDFSDLWRESSWGEEPIPYAPDLQHVYSIAFQVDAAKCAADPNSKCLEGYPPLYFDFWIDDLYLVKRRP